MSFPPLERLLHIRDEVAFLQNYRLTYTTEQLIHDAVVSRAVVRSLEIIGEASKHLPAAWCSAYAAIPWRQITQMRNRLAHQYFETDFEVVLNVLETEIDPLGETIAQMPQELPGSAE